MSHDNRRGWYVTQSFSEDFVDALRRLYRKYPEEVFAIQGIATDDTDIVKFSKRFFKSASACVADTSIDANANVREKNITQYNFETGKALMKLNSIYLMYKWVKKFFHAEAAEKALDKVISGEIFINDLNNFSMSYCFAFELRNLLEKGMNFYNGNMPIHPPRRSESFYALVIQSTAYISNQILGAASYPDFFVALDWFYRKEYGNDYVEKLSKDKSMWNHVKNQFQNLIFSFCFPFRGGQSAFTNLSIMDMGFLKQLFDDPKSPYMYPDETKPHLKSVLGISKKFFEYYAEINGKEGIFTFPVMTLAISVDKDNKYMDPDFVEWAAEANCDKATANIFVSVPTKFSSCCRLLNDFSKVAEAGYQNSFGVGGLSIGSHRVAGLNMPRIALLEKTNPDVLNEDLEILHHILVSHRRLIQHRVDGGSLPLYTAGWMFLKKQYSTIGFVGGYEYVKNHGLDIKKPEGVKKLTDALTTIEAKIKLWQESEKKEHHIFNIEQIPAESMSVRLASLDSILGFNPGKYKLYSNQYIPLIEDASIYDRFRIQGNIDSLTSGGAILHINVDDEKPLNKKQFRKLIEQARESKTSYFAVNYAYCECDKHHYSVGKHDKCPACNGKIANIFSRVVGFITPTNSWNSVRREYEFPKRVFYTNEQVIGKEEPRMV